MKRGLILLLTCTLVAAIVPRERRAVNTEEPEERPKEESVTERRICSSKTPCRWIIYGDSGRENMIIVNKYCECSSDKSCELSEDNTSAKSLVYRCKEPSLEDEDSTTTSLDS